tara:strand:+ start:2717 stop:3106 length:390 start_codon:yes stop_codon:yes gene_type:complete
MSKIRSLSKFGENCINGFLAEIIAIQDFRDNGYEIKKTGIGSDFIAFRKIPGGIDETYVEVKFGSSELTRLQKKQKFLAKKFDTQFFEYRVTREFLENFKKENHIEIENLDIEQLRSLAYNGCEIQFGK